MNGRTARSLLERMRNSPSGWGQRDIERLLSGYGFHFKEGKKHRLYFHPIFREFVISVPRHNILRDWVARDAVNIIDELKKREGSNQDGN